jgi:hypothetical protein
MRRTDGGFPIPSAADGAYGSRSPTQSRSQKTRE